MNIKCPNCKTAFVIPDTKIGDKPKKMRCSRCKEVFTVARRSQKTPIGYQEFTGRQNALPGEFAFLRASDDAPRHPADEEERVSLLDVEAEAPKTGASPPPLPKRSPAEKAPPVKAKDFPAEAPSSTYESYSPPPSFEEEKTMPGLVQSQKPGGRPQGETAEQSSAIQGAGSPPQEPAPTAPRSPTAPVKTASKAVGPGAGVKSVPENSWESEAPLELADYAAPSEHGQRIGKYIAVIWGLLALFILFVVARNGWSFSFSNISDQISYAFFGGDREVLPESVEGLEVVVGGRRVLERPGKTPLLIVEGTVYNRSVIQKNLIVVQGRLLNGNGETKNEVRLPCDKTIKDSGLMEAGADRVSALFQDGASLHNCSIASESDKPFQIVFENIPGDYNNTYSVDVKPVSAE